MSDKVRLHLGCGKRDFGPGWVHIDGGDFPHVTSHDIVNLPYGENTVDLIYASHVLEYFDRQEATDVLHKWRHVLKEEGILRLAVPDFLAMAQLYVNGGYSLDSFLGPMYGRMPMGSIMIYHKTVYDYESLSKMLLLCGFSGVRRYDWRKTEHAMCDDHSQAYLPHMDKVNGTLISLNMEAVK